MTTDPAAQLLALADAAPARDPATAPPAPVKKGEFDFTDVGNGFLFADMFADAVKFCPPEKRWYAWDGKRWAPDATREAVRCAKRLGLAKLHEAIGIADPDAQKRAIKHWLKSQSAGGVDAMLAMASSELPLVVLPVALDSDPWLLNVANGVLDLRTGRLRPHRREAMMTRLCPVEYRADADQGEWLRFLERVVPDPAARTFLQRAVGYSLTGDTREETLFFVCGPTASGKSTFAEAVKTILGDYGATCDFETFLRRPSSGGPRNDIARLHGARLVVGVEVEKGQRLAEGLVKTLTGGDKVAARFLYQEAFEFVPQFKLWLVANDRPRAADDDSALWRRILLMPFDHTIPEAERDPAVKARLRDPALGGPAVLAWAVQGCLAWQRDGLQVPEVVRRATQQYRVENDPLADWLKERCELVPMSETPFRDLYANYKNWAESAGCRPIGGKTLGLRLEAMHLTRARVGSERSRVYRGIGLRSSCGG